MDRNGCFALAILNLLICSFVQADRVASFIPMIESPNFAAFEAAYNQFIQDPTVPLDDKVVMQKELVQAVIQRKETVNEALTAGAHAGRWAVRKGVVQGILALWAAYNALGAIAMGLSTCRGKGCYRHKGKDKPLVDMEKIINTRYVCFIVPAVPSQIINRWVQSASRYLGRGIPCQFSVYIQFPIAALCAGCTCALAWVSSKNCKNDSSYKKSFEQELEQLCMIELVLANQEISV